MRTTTYLTSTIAIACLLMTTASAEKANMSAEKLTKTATDVIVAEVRAIYTHQETIGQWQYTRYAAEIRVCEIEKGEGLQKGELAYVRYWERRWGGAGFPPPSTSGHRGLPSKGDVVRVYLAQDAYDGFTRDNNDGGFNVIGANGFEVIKDGSDKKAEGSSP